MRVMQTLPQDKESYGSDTSHDRKRQLLGGRGVLSLRSFVGKALALFLLVRCTFIKIAAADIGNIFNSH